MQPAFALVRIIYHTITSVLFWAYHCSERMMLCAYISKKKRLHPDAPRAPCASGGPGAYNVNSRPGCAVYWGVLVNRGPCRPEAPDATQDSKGTGRRKVLQTQPDRIVE